MSKSLMPAGVGAAFLIAGATAVHAHHPDLAMGGNGAGIVTISASTLEEGHFSFALVTQFAGFKDVNFNALNAGEHTHQIKSFLSPSLMAAYGITNDLSIAVSLPWIKRKGVVDGHIHNPGGSPHVESLGDSSGFGDLTTLLQWRFFKQPDIGFEIAALAGVKLPTGKTGERNRFGDRFDAEFQPGSGSIDGLFGMAVSKSFGGWSVHANVLYLLATEGTQHTDLGDRLYYNAAVAWRAYGGPNENGVVSSAFALDLVLEVNGEWQARQQAHGERDPNSGGNVIWLSPGLRGVYRGSALSLSVGLPVVRDLNGLQSKPSWRLFTAISTSF